MEPKKQEQPNIPLSVILENAKGRMTEAVNKVIEDTNLPPSLIEGILNGILADVRSQKNLELISDINRMKSEAGKEEGAE